MQTILPSSGISLQLSKLEGYIGICQCFSGASLLCKLFVIILVFICGSLFFCVSFSFVQAFCNSSSPHL